MIVIFTTIMKVFIHRILVLLFAGAALIAIVNSCSNILPCNTQRVRNVEFTFVYMVKKKPVDVTVKMIRIEGEKSISDSFVYNTTVHNGGLPLSMLKDSTIYFLGHDSVLYDTILFHTKRELSVESSDCGFNYSFIILNGSYTRNMIDSIIVLNKTVSVDVENNIKFVVRDTTRTKYLPLKIFN